MNYESIIAEILKRSDEHEKERIMQEDALFKRRGWCKMIELLCGLIERTEKSFYIYYKGSFLDSYLIYKYAELRQIDLSHLYHVFRNGSEGIGDRILNGDKARSILFNDALRITIDIVYMVVFDGLQHNTNNRLIEFNNTFEDLIRDSGLRKKEVLIDSSTELMVLSNDEISDSDMEVVLKEETESSPEEIEVLHKTLIVRIKVVHAL